MRKREGLQLPELKLSSHGQMPKAKVKDVEERRKVTTTNTYRFLLLACPPPAPAATQHASMHGKCCQQDNNRQAGAGKAACRQKCSERGRKE